ncbi:MAG TPA: MATE family efflux transporter [Aestuariivirgaceae bacterium]|nr:MATE family efflux transporter [Aestuariivirgaceae bacterium]
MDAPSRPPIARFVTGSTMRHVVVMTLTSSVGLMALFFVDLASLFFLNLLGRTEITAAIGYAGAISFTNLSLSLGLGIAASALVSRSLGARELEKARRYATSALAATTAVAILIAVLTAIFTDPLLALLGATGEAAAEGRRYLQTLMPGFPAIAGAVTCSFILRAIGDPTRAMYVTLTAAAINGVLDPITIFVLGLGLQGAAVSTLVAYLVSLLVGLYGVQRVHRMLAPFRLEHFREDLRPVFDIAIPAMLTQLATPFAAAYLTRIAAQFGDEAVAAVAIINRLVPVAFGVIFSLSSAVGPIIGQNYGAGEFGRVRQSLHDAIIFACTYTLLTAFALFLLRDIVPAIFNVHGDTAALVTFYCTYVAVSFAFTGAQFVAQAAFNNLGRPHWSTVVNWGRATIGTVPFLHAGAMIAGAAGMLVGSALGSVIFGSVAVAAAYWLTSQIERTMREAGESRAPI